MREWVAAPFLFIRGGVICSVFFWLPIRQAGAGNVFIRRTGTAGARFPRSVTFGASPQGAKKWKAVCAAALKSEKKRRVVSPASVCRKSPPAAFIFECKALFPSRPYGAPGRETA